MVLVVMILALFFFHDFFEAAQRETFFVEKILLERETLVWFGLVWFGLVWFGLVAPEK